jgi:hypothetical protein
VRAQQDQSGPLITHANASMTHHVKLTTLSQLDNILNWEFLWGAQVAKDSYCSFVYLDTLYQLHGLQGFE